jgi:hypothetical protein
MGKFYPFLVDPEQEIRLLLILYLHFPKHSFIQVVQIRWQSCQMRLELVQTITILQSCMQETYNKYDPEEERLQLYPRYLWLSVGL